jgi:co-chaperonin GroES (HSP10)
MIEGRILPLYVLAKEVKESETTESGLLIKPTLVMKKEHMIGEVVLTGDGTNLEEMKIKIGDKILFHPHSFRRFTHPIDQQEYLLVAQKDVMLMW